MHRTVPSKICLPNVSIVPRLRNPEVGVDEAAVGKAFLFSSLEHMCSLAGRQFVTFVTCLPPSGDFLVTFMRSQKWVDITKQRQHCSCCVSWKVVITVVLASNTGKRLHLFCALMPEMTFKLVIRSHLLLTGIIKQWMGLLRQSLEVLKNWIDTLRIFCQN